MPSPPTGGREETNASPAGAEQAADVSLPPEGAAPDYQLGGPYNPADGLYSICYVNALQTQPGELDAWPDDLLLHDADGAVVFDPDWPDEALVDTATAAQRERIAATVSERIRGCADDGFDAVEFDNLDSYSRSDGLLSLEDNLDLAAALVDAAHDAGLAAGQKNAAEDAAALQAEAGFDFAVVEECAAYEECGAYAAVYGAHVVDIEYTDELPRPFAEMCADAASPESMVLRDRDLLPAGEDGHVFEVC